MALTIQQFRQKYPRYNDVNDVDLAKALHQKFAPETSFEVFTQKFMATPSAPQTVNTLGGIGGIRSTPIPASDLSALADEKVSEYERYEAEKTGAAAKRYAIGEQLSREKFVGEFGKGYEKMGGVFAEPVRPKVAGALWDFGKTVREKFAENMPTETRRETIRTAAGMAGGMGPHPIVFSGIAGGASEAMYQIGQHLVGSEAAPQTSGEAAGRIGIAAGIESTQEGLFRIGKSIVSPGGDISLARREAVEYMRSKGIDPTAFQATGSRGPVGVLEGVVEASFTGGPSMLRRKEIQEQLFKNLGDDIVTRFGGLSPTDAGNLIAEMVVEKKGVRTAASGALHRQIGEEAKDFLLPVAMHKKRAAALLKKLEGSVVTETLTTKATGLLDQFGKPILKETTEQTKEAVMPSMRNTELIKTLREIVALPDKLPYSIINENIKKPMGEIAFAHPMEKTGRMFTEETERELKNFYHDITAVYSNPEYGLPKRLLPLLEKANKLTEGIHEDYEKKLVQRIVKEHPEKVVKAIIQKNAPVNIDEVIAAAGPEVKDVLKGAFIHDLLTDKALVKKGEDMILSGGQLIDYIDRQVGSEVVEKFTDKESVKELRRFGDALRIYNARPPEFGGGVTIKIIQAGSAMSLIGIAATSDDFRAAGGIGAGGIILGPMGLSWMFRNKTAVHALENAMISEEAGTQTFARLLSRIAANPAFQKAQKQDEANAAKGSKENVTFRSTRNLGQHF